MLITKYTLKQICEVNKTGIIVIDCNYAIFGRLLSFVAKLSQNEKIKKIYLTNIDDIIFKSRLDKLMRDYKLKLSKGLNKGPYYPLNNSKFLKYILRSMYPKTKQGMYNYKKVITWQVMDLENSLCFKKPNKIVNITKYKHLLCKLRET